jgi:hypothetical protein
MTSRYRDAAHGSKDVRCDLGFRRSFSGGVNAPANRFGFADHGRHCRRKPGGIGTIADQLSLVRQNGKGRGSNVLLFHFRSYRQCMTTISGVGDYCYQSPYYHASLAGPRRR